jgi:hypothetical protein
MHLPYPVNPILYEGEPMADDRQGMEFEEIPLEEARRMGRGPRMEPLLYDTLRTKIQSLSTEATRIRLGPEIQPARMKNYLLRIARELNVPVVVRNIPNGVVFWRATAEDEEQAQAISQRLHKPQPKPQAPRKGRPRRA